MRYLRAQRFNAEEHNEKLHQLFSFHLVRPSTINWKKINSLDLPEKPSNDHALEIKARMEQEQFSPSIFDRLFQKTEAKVQLLEDEVKLAVERDNLLFNHALQEHSKQMRDWQEWHELSSRVIDFDIESMVKALQKLKPQAILEEYSSDFHFYPIGRRKIKVSFCVRSKNIIPTEKQKILKSGRVSITQFSENQLNKMYKEHICSLTLRVFIDIISSVPIQEVLVVVNAKENYEGCNVTAEIPIFLLEGNRELLKLINPMSVNASENLWFFTHVMNFRGKTGFHRIKSKQQSLFVDLYDKSSFHFYCNGCGIRYIADPPLEGKTAKCKQCGLPITVPKID